VFHVEQPFQSLFLSRFKQHPASHCIARFLSSEMSDLTVGGLVGSALSFFLLAVRDVFHHHVVVVSDNPKEAENIRDDMAGFWGDESVCFFTGLEHQTYFYSEFESIALIHLNDAIHKLTARPSSLLITTPAGLLTPLPSRHEYFENSLQLKEGAPFAFDRLVSFLTENGFRRVTTVEYPSEFAVKGGIIDFFPSHEVMPLRVEFEDDLIASIRQFNPNDQLSVRKIEFFDLNQSFSTQLLARYSSNLFSFLPPETLFVFAPADSAAFSKLSRPSSSYRTIHAVTNPPYDCCFPGYPIDFTDNTVASFKTILDEYQKRHPAAENFLISSSKSQSERMGQLLSGWPIRCIDGTLSSSVAFPELSLVFYADHDVFRRERRSFSLARISEQFTHERADQIEFIPGDYLVHINYGIGRYLGLDRIEAFGALRECLSIEYANQSRVYVPLEKFKDVQKYKASDGFFPPLSRLGSNDWDQVKQRTRKSVELINKDIIRLYSERLYSFGYAFSSDCDMQATLEAEFAFEETPDQDTATAEIKADMEKTRPMDRLLCGDVGFGKTEVAIRAAFKAAMDSKQVAVLVPTTILADQHFITFSERLKNYPVKVAMLSRFVNNKSSRQVLADIKTGLVDIVIGTHRLLSADIVFHDLGLLIIDEEHRFGVRHKEKIKNLRKNLDVLSLSATPIPRTLQFSLIGVRDFSIINTPPKSRLPVYTEIIYFDKQIICEAVSREIERGGQIFFVHNEIQSITIITSKLQGFFPSLRIRYVHGQMKENELEPIMRAFIEHQIDILVTTAIIESGIDIPNANTIFINQANYFGLAQLYQLRGRVGRSNRRAYAYLIIPQRQRLQPEAIKRLQTIQRFSSLGSGYSVALRDLEIRGAGNVFGMEQSGNIQAVGYDLYMKILKDSIDDIKDGFHPPEERTPQKFQLDNVDIIFPRPVLIPDSYISDSSIRLSFYRRLSDAVSVEAVDLIAKELVDRFGKFPEEILNLIDVSGIRILASLIGISKVKLTEKAFHISFSDPNAFDDFNILSKTVMEICRNTGITFKYLPSDGLDLIIYTGNKPLVPSFKLFLKLLFDAVNFRSPIVKEVIE